MEMHSFKALTNDDEQSQILKVQLGKCPAEHSSPHFSRPSDA
jgi:hypothetical protein